MNIVKKEWVYKSQEIAWYALSELREYDFDNKIDFTSDPIFTYDCKHQIVYNPIDNNSPSKVIINDVTFLLEEKITPTNSIIELESGVYINKKVERIQLSKNYGLQDFFNEHKNAKCIVFFIYTSSIFHEGYSIRVFIDEEGYTPKDQSEN